MIELNKIYDRDCLCQDGLPIIVSQSVDLILTDPPYGMTAQHWDNIVDFNMLWNEYWRILKPSGTIAIFSSEPFTTMLISSQVNHYKYSWYWIKNQATNFFHAKRMPLRKVEQICIFYKSNNYYPQFSYGHVPTNSAKGCSNGNLYYGDNVRNYKGGSTKRYPNNVLEYNCVNNYSRVHPNEKPVKLLEYLIKTYTKEDELVVDPFIGSGNTAIASINMDRKYIGFDNGICTNKKSNNFGRPWADIANERIG